MILFFAEYCQYVCGDCNPCFFLVMSLYEIIDYIDRPCFCFGRVTIPPFSGRDAALVKTTSWNEACPIAGYGRDRYGSWLFSVLYRPAEWIVSLIERVWLKTELADDPLFIILPFIDWLLSSSFIRIHTFSALLNLLGNSPPPLSNAAYFVKFALFSSIADYFAKPNWSDALRTVKLFPLWSWGAGNGKNSKKRNGRARR